MVPEMLKSFGASPIFISSGELYMALSKGMADGYMTGFDSIHSRKLYEVTKYVTNAGLSYSSMLGLINLKFWNNLPEETRQVMLRVASETENKVAQWTDEREAFVIKDIREKGVNVFILSSEERKPFVGAAKPVWDGFVKRHGKDAEEILQWVKENVKD